MTKLLKTYKMVGKLFGKKKFSWKLSFIMNSFQSLIASVGLGYSIKLLIDGATMSNDRMMNRGFIILLVSVLYLIFILPVLTYLQDTNVATIKSQMEINIFNRIIRKSYKKLTSFDPSEIITVLQNDVSEVSELYGWNMVALLQALVSGVGSMLLVLLISRKLFLFLLVFSMTLLFVNKLFTKNIYKLDSQIRELIEDRLNTINELLDNSIILHIYHMMNKIRTKFNRLNTAKCETEYSIYVNMNKIDFLVNLVSELVVGLGVIILGCYLISVNEITLGQLMFVFELKFGALFLFGSVGDYINNVQSAIVASERIVGILKDEKEMISEKKVLNDIDSISMTHVSFSYSDDSDRVLDNISFNTLGKENVCFIGENGKGKSTIIKLLMGLFDGYTGKIQINGTDVSKINTESLFSVVPQDVVILTGTIKDNIEFGNTATEDEIIKAAKDAQIYDEICKKEAGFDTVVQEDGENLSSGQKQRIAIARALIQKKPILILDECTANLDDETAAQVIGNLLSLKSRKIIAISHDKKISKKFDKVITI
jgi:ABC-type multidrug/protein/lipid transport system, ATPase component